MTIDERLERLAERQAALTRMVERMAHTQQAAHRGTAETRTDARFAEIATDIHALMVITRANEQRLFRQDGSR
jgi:hypothetical protein